MNNPRHQCVFVPDGKLQNCVWARVLIQVDIRQTYRTGAVIYTQIRCALSVTSSALIVARCIMLGTYEKLQY